MLPQALSDAIEALGHLPGVGARTAERYAYFLFKNNPRVAKDIAATLDSLHDGVKNCPVTFALINVDDEVSVTVTSTQVSASVASTVTVPPDGVNLRALSANVFTIKSVNALSAFKIDFVDFTCNVRPACSKLRCPFFNTSNTIALLCCTR